MATYKPIQSITLTADTTTVTFSGIDQNYTDLEVIVNARGSYSSNANFYYRINGDSTSSYTVIRLQGDGSSVVSNKGTASTTGYIGYVDGSNSTSGIFGATKIYINNYSNSTTYKTLLSKGATPGTGGYAAFFVNGYAGSTAAVTSISFTPDAGNWVAGSTFSLYGIKSGAPQALGGDLVTRDSNYWYHTFNSTQIFTPLRQLTVDYLVVAGGAGGGNHAGGGGGAGGLRSTVTQTGGNAVGVNLETALSLTAQPYTVTVGAGGAGMVSQGNSGTSLQGNDGSNSVFASITATGGGGGGAINNTAGRSGGSGGGAGGTVSASGGNGTTNQGYAGGAANSTQSGGGGGAGAAGSTSNGGAGVAVAISGSSVTYAGGGGGAQSSGGGTGGSGGGGNGGNNSGGNPTSGTVNTGSGGGAHWYAMGTNATNAGGSGIVIVRYPV